MAINSRQKGARGERKFAAYLRDLGIDPDARRGQQYSGSADSPDVVSPALAGIHIEVKCVEGLEDHTAAFDEIWAKAWQEATPARKTPVIAWKHNRRPWRLTYVDQWGIRTTTTGDARIRKALQCLGGVE